MPERVSVISKTLYDFWIKSFSINRPRALFVSVMINLRILFWYRIVRCQVSCLLHLVEYGSISAICDSTWDTFDKIIIITTNLCKNHNQNPLPYIKNKENTPKNRHSCKNCFWQIKKFKFLNSFDYSTPKPGKKWF